MVHRVRFQIRTLAIFNIKKKSYVFCCIKHSLVAKDHRLTLIIGYETFVNIQWTSVDTEKFGIGGLNSTLTEPTQNEVN